VSEAELALPALPMALLVAHLLTHSAALFLPSPATSLSATLWLTVLAAPLLAPSTTPLLAVLAAL
jgi:hypothetical protein